MNLLVAMDGSQASRRALVHALWLAKGRADAVITVVNVQNYDTVGISEIDPGAEHARDIAGQRSRAILRHAAAACAKAGIACRSRAEFGGVCEAIIRVARETHADQIVMGSRGRGRLRTVLLDTVVIGVLGAADIPVTVVTKRARGMALASLRS